MVDKGEPLEGWDALLLLRDQPLNPGETRRLGFVFLSGQEAVKPLRAAGRFYLWDGRFIGEAVVVEDFSSDDAFLAADSGRGHKCMGTTALVAFSEVLAARGAWIDIVEAAGIEAGLEVSRVDLSIYGDHGCYDQPADLRREMAAERLTKMLAIAAEDAAQLSFTVWLDRDR